MGGFLERLRRLLSDEPDVQVDPDNPRVSLELAYQRQLDALSRVRRVRADLGSARQRIDHQVGRLVAEADRLTLEAEHALAAGDAGAAREALVHKHDLEQDLAELDAQRRALAAEQEAVGRAADDLRAAAEALRAQRERRARRGERRRGPAPGGGRPRRAQARVGHGRAAACRCLGLGRGCAGRTGHPGRDAWRRAARPKPASRWSRTSRTSAVRYQQPPTRGSGPGDGNLR